MNLTNKVALVTGAGSGIGKAAAVKFAKAGARVAVLSHTADEIKKTADEITQTGGTAIAVVADIGDAASMEHAVKKTIDAFGALHIVFANAGINGVQAPIEDITPDEWHKTIQTNLTGTFYTIKYTVPFLKQAGGGAIVITASINGTRVFSNSGASAYATTKAGQVALAKMTALELARSRIRVNVVCPGAIDTDIDDNTQPRDLDKIRIKAEYSDPHPLAGKPGTSDDVADLALFLVSDASKHITGTEVWIDGAESLLRG